MVQLLVNVASGEMAVLGYMGVLGYFRRRIYHSVFCRAFGGDRVTRPQPITEITEQDWDEIIAVSLRSF